MAPVPPVPPVPPLWSSADLPPERLRRTRFQWGLALALFVLTFLSVATIGPVLLLFSRSDATTPLWPALLPGTVMGVWHDPRLLASGLQVAGSLLTILLAHEMGHYLACRRYGLASTPPYFLPVPFGFGTLGAFIRIRSPLTNKRQLFDVGVAGPLAGFVVLLPFLVYGVAHSQVGSYAETADGPLTNQLLLPGNCLGIGLLSWFFHGPLGPGQTLNLHPLAFGAWFGVFATALNLLPLSQLDGGHLLYATFGPWQRRLARPLWLVLAAAGWFWHGWWVWCGLLLFLGLNHPPVLDEDRPLDPARRWIAALALLILVLCFSPVPFRQIAVR